MIIIIYITNSTYVHIYRIVGFKWEFILVNFHLAGLYLIFDSMQKYVFQNIHFIQHKIFIFD